MLNYRVNTRKFNKTKINLPVESISFTDFETLVDNCILTSDYDGNKLGKVMATCECLDIDKISNGGTINVVNTLYLNTERNQQQVFTFNQDYNIVGVNRGNKSFSFYFDKYILLEVEKITSGEDNEDKIIIYFKDLHYFDATEEKILLRFRYIKRDNSIVEKDIPFTYLSPKTLVTSYEDFDDSEIYTLVFSTDMQEDSAANKLKYVNKFHNEVRLDEEQYQALGDGDKSFYVIDDTTRERSLSFIQVYRANYIFRGNTYCEFTYERPLGDINVPIVNTFETTLYQMELLNEHFVNAEKKKAINGITDIEKDVYYPCISNINQDAFVDIYTIKFNLHFREHRGDDWLVENESFWNCVEKDLYGKAKIVDVPMQMTLDNKSDLLTFLGFTNNDVRYQKNKLKKSFLRLMYYDSMNPANQNLIGYSTIFFDTGNMFTKYVKHIKDEGYISVGANKNNYGIYSPSEGKIGIRVDREHISNNDDLRLGSQFVVKSKNMSKSSSEGFYIYIWKDNEMALPQDLYMKVEFNHAGYGRTIPFMMPYWDNQKWNGRSGIKTFQEILDDWNSNPENGLDRYDRVVWKNNGVNTDGHYGIRQYTKFSYIHLKYKYDKENDKHIYYLDPNTYGDNVINQNTNEIVINLYEAKVE